MKKVCFWEHVGFLITWLEFLLVWLERKQQERYVGKQRENVVGIGRMPRSFLPFYRIHSVLLYYYAHELGFIGFAIVLFWFFVVLMFRVLLFGVSACFILLLSLAFQYHVYGILKEEKHACTATKKIKYKDLVFGQFVKIIAPFGLPSCQVHKFNLVGGFKLGLLLRRKHGLFTLRLLVWSLSLKQYFPHVVLLYFLLKKKKCLMKCL